MLCTPVVRALLALVVVLSTTLISSGQVRISQVFAHGGSLAAQPRADFVELFNAGISPVALTGWSIQIAQPTGTIWSVVPLSGFIGPRQYYLVQVSSNLAVGMNLPAPDAGPSSSDLPQTGGKVALVIGTAAISGRPACPFSSSVIDFLGYGNADQRTPCGLAGATTNNAPAPSFNTALFRRCDGFADAGSNQASFELRPPSPRNSASPANSAAEIIVTPAAATLQALPGESVTLTVSAVASACAGTLTSVTANLSPIGGPSSVALSPAGPGQYQTVINLATLNVQPGSYSINVAARASVVNDLGTAKVTLLVRPPNDSCVDAVVIDPGALPAAFTVNNDGAQPDIDPGTCTSATQGFFGVWYSITPTLPGILRVEQTGTQSAAIGIFAGTCASPSSIACSETGLASLNVLSGVEYRILIARTGPTPQLAPPLVIAIDFSTISPNDSPCAAIPIALDAPRNGSNADATSQDDGPLVDCAGSAIAAVKGVWYSFTPPQSGLYAISTCGSPINTDLAIFTSVGCPGAPALTLVSGGCATQGCLGGEPGPGPAPGSPLAASIGQVSLDAGVNYLIRITSANTPIGGSFRLQVARVVTGACCNYATGVCSLTTTGACPAGQTYLGGDSTCTPGLCVIATNGACCDFTSGACSLTSNGACPIGQTFQGVDSICTPGLCVRNNDECAGAIPLIVGGPTFGSSTTATTTVSLGTFQCGTVNGSDGADVFYSFVPPATTAYQISLCGSDFDTVMGVHTACPVTLVNRIACNDDADPSCSSTDRLSSRIRSVILNAGVTYHIRVSGFSSAAGRFSIGIDQSGLCCRGTTCTRQFDTPQACMDSAVPGVGAMFVGAVSDCNLQGVTTFPCCHADFNKSGTITPQDIFDYLNAWFDGSTFAKFGGDGSEPPVVQDIFDFVNAWFIGGC